jgi:hypothetical protein
MVYTAYLVVSLPRVYQMCKFGTNKKPGTYLLAGLELSGAAGADLALLKVSTSG